MRQKICRTVISCAVIFLTIHDSAHADVGQIINLDIQGGTFEGSGPILTNGQDYYAYSISSASGEKNKRIPLIESDGSFSIARISYTADSSTAISALGSSSMANTPYTLLFDGYMTAVTTRTISYTGLDQNRNYALAVYSQAEKGRATSLYINGYQVLRNPDSSASTLISGVNYALVTIGLTSDVNGYLSITYQGQLDGLQLQELPDSAPTTVPEPQSLMLIGIGFLGIARFRYSTTAA